MAALATERWLAEKSLAKTIVRETPEPEKKLNSSDFNEEEVNEDTFDSNAEWQKVGYALRKLYHESKKPILVIFSSPSCGPCHVLKPQLKRVIKELDGAVLGGEIDIDKDQDIAKQAGINGTPTIQLFKEKLLKKQWQGVKQRSEFKEAIKNIILSNFLLIISLGIIFISSRFSIACIPLSISYPPSREIIRTYLN